MKPMTLTIDDYLRIKQEIEQFSPGDGRTISDSEFNWTYHPNTGLTRLKEYDDPSEVEFLKGKAAFLSRFEFPRGTNAVAHMHNHPSGSAIPSYADLENLLKFTLLNEGRHMAIAATKKGIVSGYFEAEYAGEKHQLLGVMLVPRSYNKTMCENRIHDVKSNPDKYPHIKPGLPIFDQNELAKIAREIMSQCHITYKLIQMPGYEIDGWEFHER